MERLTQSVMGKYLLPIIPAEINSKEELDKFHEVRRFYENCVIRLGSCEDIFDKHGIKDFKDYGFFKSTTKVVILEAGLKAIPIFEPVLK